MLGAILVLAGCGGSLGLVGGLGGPDGGGGAAGGAGGAGGRAGRVDGGGFGGATDPMTASTISGLLDQLPGTPPAGPQRAELIDALSLACAAFGPEPVSDVGWDPVYCWAHLAAAIEKESTYDPNARVVDAFAMRGVLVNGTMVQANDPTVGLLQIRFSSTVRDMAAAGMADRLATLGCMFPSFSSYVTESADSEFWAVTGPSESLDAMASVGCNVALGAWYYYAYATGNGNASEVTSMAQYCAGGGTAGNLITGLLSHLEGPDPGKGVIPDMAGLAALQTSNPAAYDYVTSVKTWFDDMVGPFSGAHPFFLPLAPNPAQYCGN